MKRSLILVPAIVMLLAGLTFAQKLVPPVVANYRLPDELVLQITKAEDSRDVSGVSPMLKNVNAAVRSRAALAAGRIGDESAVEPLAALLDDAAVEVKTMAAFALGEIESMKAADAVLKGLRSETTPDAVRARLVEAAGKIAAANAAPAIAPAESRDPKVAELGNVILDVLEAEEAKREKQHVETILLGLTAALRARPEGSDNVVALFLTNLNPRVRADAANTFARLRSKTANLALRGMLMSDEDPIARANAARALGAADDKEAVNMLIEAAVGDDDQRVRVSAIRSLALLRDPYAVEKLLDHAEKLLAAFNQKAPRRAPAKRVSTGGGTDRGRARSASANPPEKSELLEIVAALGRLVPKTNDARTVKFLTNLGQADHFRSPETEIAFARVAPKLYYEYLRSKKDVIKASVPAVDATVQGIRELAGLGGTPEELELKAKAADELGKALRAYKAGEKLTDPLSVPELLRAYAAFKPEGLDAELRRHLSDKSVFIRATAASLLADRPADKANVDALKSAFTRALQTDKEENDAQLGIMEAIYKLDKNAAVPTLLIALNAPDYIVRKRAFEMLGDPAVRQGNPKVDISLEKARKEHRDHVLPYPAGSGTKLGQVLNTNADYRRALSRRNGSVKAVLTTQKGTFTIELLPEDAPLTVDNFIRLAKARFFNGLAVHRVVPNFVMQDGDPRGDGNGGPGWSIRCEINMVPFERGVVGMALSGKDTGGSQWFVTHSPQPHLDGGYTVFGRVNESGMKIVDSIVRGDKIISVRIVESNSPRRVRRK